MPTRHSAPGFALLYVIEPIFERGLAEHSYGFRPGRNAHQAVGRVEKLLEAGHTWVVDTARGLEDTETGTPQGAVISPLLANNRGWE